jgi:L-histidine Nalpha-methyltransferase
MAVAVCIPNAVAEFAGDVREGLTLPQKRLPSKYLYDDLGSALFEAICLLPEYGLTRAETRILLEHSSELVRALPENLIVAELGSGSGQKTRILLDAIVRRNHQRETLYHPIEISSAALQRCESELLNVPGIRCSGVQAEYLNGLRQTAALRRPGQHVLVLFLGSSIGNFSNEEGARFLSQLRGILKTGDALLLAADLIKPVDKLLAAYDDPIGVTAAFNLNLLARMNRELRANFDLSEWEHQALFNEQTQSMEMYLRSRTDQCIAIQELGLLVAMRRGETIWTETSHKYSPAELNELAKAAGFRVTAQWLDPSWGFADNLWSVA